MLKVLLISRALMIFRLMKLAQDATDQMKPMDEARAVMSGCVEAWGGRSKALQKTSITEGRLWHMARLGSGAR